MEVKGLSNLIVAKQHVEIKAKYRASPRTPRCGEERSKYISSIERLRASNIVIAPKTPLRRSSSISRERGVQIAQRKQSLSITDARSTNTLQNQAQSVLCSLKQPKKPLKFQAEDDFLQSVSRFSVKSITELKKRLNYQLKGLDSLFAFLIILADCDPALGFVDSYKGVTLKMIDDFKVYISNPGKLVQTIRNIPSCIRNGNLQGKSIAKAKEHLGRPTEDLKEVHNVVSETIKLFEIVRPTGKPEETKDAPFVCRVKKEVIDRKRIPTDSYESDYVEAKSSYVSTQHNTSIHLIEADTHCSRVSSTNKAKLLNKFLNDTKHDDSVVSENWDESPRRELPQKQAKEHPVKDFLQEGGQVENLVGLVQSLMGSPVFKELINGLKEDGSQRLLREILNNAQK